MKLLSKIIRVLLFLSLSSGVLFAQKLPETIHVTTLKGPTGMGMMKLLEDKVLTLKDGRSVRIEFEIAGSPDIVDARILSGQADFVTLPVNQAARLYTKTQSLKLAGVNVWGVLYLVSLDPGLKDISQVDGSFDFSKLKGKTLYNTGKGASPDLLLRSVLETGSLKDGDYSLDYRYGQIELAQLLIGKKIDLALMPEPFASKVLLANPQAFVALDLQKAWEYQHKGKGIAQGGLGVRSDFAQAYPEITQAFIEAYAASNEEIALDPKAAERIAKLDLGIDAASFKAAQKRLNLHFVSAQDAKEEVDEYLKLLFETNPQSLGGALPAPAFYWVKN